MTHIPDQLPNPNPVMGPSQQPNHAVYRAMRKALAIGAIAVTTMSSTPIANAFGQMENNRAVGYEATETALEHSGKQATFRASMPEAAAGDASDTNLGFIAAVKKPEQHKVKDTDKEEHNHKHQPKHHKEKKKPIHRKTVTPVTTDLPPITVPQPKPIELTPPSITPEALSVMTKNAIYMPALGCSGWTLSDQNGNPVGVLTAKHCLLDADNSMNSNSDAPQTLNINQSIVAYNGNTFGDADTANDMEPVGIISSFYATTSNENDLAVGIFEGQDPQSVVDIAQSALMPMSQSSALPEGTTIYDRGMPAYQPKDAGAPEMQNFGMSVLGSENWTVTDNIYDEGTTVNEQVNLEVAAVALSPDGSECSYGNSGSVAFIMGPNGQPQLIGVATGFNDWGYLYAASNSTQAQANINYYQAKYNTNLSSYSAVCGFSQQLPTVEEGAQLIPVVVQQ